MIKRLRITVLADNCVAAPDLLAEHGLSMLIEADHRRILFDTGQAYLRGRFHSRVQEVGAGSILTMD
jgi:metal-dependent hydrolase (beta-lactamase superfamily II)